MKSNRVLLCDSKNFNNADILKYDEIFLIESVLGSIEHKKIKKIALPTYFMRSHKLARDINKILLEAICIQSELHCSLLKSTDKTIFAAARIIEVLKDMNQNDNIDIKTDYNQYLNYFFNILDIDYKNLNLLDTQKKKFKLSFFKNIVKILILMINSLKVKKRDNESIFFMYNDKISFEFAKPYLENCLSYPFFSLGLSSKVQKYDDKDYFQYKNYLQYKYISPTNLLYGIKAYCINKKSINSSNLPEVIKLLYIEELLNLEINSMMILSLKIKFNNLKTIMGLFDAYASIDYITYHLNSLYNIKTICIPHGINFRYKVHYISYGVNTYSFWSNDHLQRMKESNLILDNKIKRTITGNIVYKNTLSKLNKKNKKGKNILVVGEYFSKDNYYLSPFNSETAKIFFDTLSGFIKLHKDCKLTIRARLNDDYAKLSQLYISKRVFLSSPAKSMIEEINENDLIITVFSNALHEALLLEKEVLQVNLLGIENYRDLAKDSLVYYADTKEAFLNNLENWYNNKLPLIDYPQHLDKYCNNAEFLKLKEEL